VALVGAFLLEIVAGYKTYSLGATSLTWEAFKKIMNGGEAYGLGAENAEFSGALIAFMGGKTSRRSLDITWRAKEKKLGFLIPPGSRLCDLSGALAESQSSSNYRRLNLDAGGNRFWSLEDLRIPQGNVV